MPERDYLGKVYDTLREGVEGFDKDENTFRGMMSDTDYASKVYSTLGETVDGFDKTPEQFYEMTGSGKPKSPSFSTDMRNTNTLPVMKNSPLQANVVETVIPSTPKPLSRENKTSTIGAWEKNTQDLRNSDVNLNSFYIGVGKTDLIPDANIKAQMKQQEDVLKATRAQYKNKTDLSYKELVPVMNTISSFYVKDKSTIDLLSKTNESGDRVADPIKVDEQAKAIARQYGVPEDGYFKNLIYEDLKSKINYSYKEKDIIKQADAISVKQFGKPLSELVNEDFQKNFKAEAEIKATAELQAKALAAQVTSENNKTQKEIGNVYEPLIKETNKAYEDESKNIAAQADAQLNSLSNTYKAGGMDYETYTQQFNAIKEQNAQYSEQIHAEYVKNFQTVSSEYLTKLKESAGKYDARYKRQLDEIDRISNSRLTEEAKKYSASYKMSPEMAAKYKKVWEEASVKVGVKYEEYNLLRDRAKGIIDLSIQSLTSGLGTGIKGISSFMNFEDGKLFGDILSTSNTLSSANIESSMDLLDLTKVIRSSGEMIGGMTPILAANAIAAMATQGASVPTQMMLLGGLNWSLETMQMAGDAHNEVFTNTGSLEDADNASKKVITGQAYLLPLYAISGLPFIGKATLGIKNLMIRTLAKGGVEVLDEIPQEFFQSSIEELARENKDLSEIGAKLTFERLKSTALNVAPSTFLMGAAPSSFASIKKSWASMEAKAYGAKQDISRLSPTGLQQFMYEITLRHGEAFAKSYLVGLEQTNKIDAVQLDELNRAIDMVKPTVETTKKFGFTAGKSKVYASILFDYQKTLANIDTEKDPIVKKALETKAKELEAAASDFLNTGTADYAIMHLPNGEQYLATYSQVQNWLNDEKFANRIMNGSIDITIETSKDKSTAKLLQGVIADLKTQKPAASEKISLTETVEQSPSDRLVEINIRLGQLEWASERGEIIGEIGERKRLIDEKKELEQLNAEQEIIPTTEAPAAPTSGVSGEVQESGNVEQLTTKQNEKDNKQSTNEANGEVVLEGVRETGNENEVGKSSEQLREEEIAALEERRKQELDNVIQTVPIEVKDEKGNVIQTSDQKVEINARYDKELAELKAKQEKETTKSIEDQIKDLRAAEKAEPTEPSKSDKNYQDAQEANSIISKENPDASVLLQPKGEDLSLTAVYVGKEKRGKGIGSKVLESVRKQADKLGKKVVLDATNELDSKTDLERLGKFYERNGFTKVGENKYEYNPAKKEAVEVTPKEGDTSITKSARGMIQNMTFKDGEWQMKFGKDFTTVSSAVRQEAQDAFNEKNAPVAEVKEEAAPTVKAEEKPVKEQAPVIEAPVIEAPKLEMPVIEETVTEPMAAEEEEQYEPITVSDTSHDTFTKDNAVDYEEGEREGDNGRSYTYLASVTVELVDDVSGDTIGTISKLKSEDGEITWNAENNDGYLVAEEASSKSEAQQALVDNYNKQKLKEFNKEKAKAAKEKIKEAEKAKNKAQKIADKEQKALEKIKEKEARKKKLEDLARESGLDISEDDESPVFSVELNENLAEDQQDEVKKIVEEAISNPEFATSEVLNIQDELAERIPMQQIVVDENDTRPEAQMMSQLSIPLDFIFGKSIGIGMSDTLTTGERTVPVMDTKTGEITDKKVREEGGLGYPFKSLIDLINGALTEGKKAMGWAGINDSTSTKMKNAAKLASKITGKELKVHYFKNLKLTAEQKQRIEDAIPDKKEYGIIVIYKMGDDGIKSNEAYAREAFRLIDVTLSAEEKQDFFKKVKERLVGENSIAWLEKDKYRSLIEKANSFLELQDVLHGTNSKMPLIVKTEILEKGLLSTRETESSESVNPVGFLLKSKGITVESVADNIAEPVMNGITSGQPMLAIAVDPDAEIFNDVKRERHGNYPYSVEGLPIGIFQETAPFHNLSPELMDVFVKSTTTQVQELKNPDGTQVSVEIVKYGTEGLLAAYVKTGTGKKAETTLIENSEGKTEEQVWDKLKKMGYTPRISIFQNPDGTYSASEGSGEKKILLLDKKGSPITAKTIELLYGKLKKAGVKLDEEFKKTRFSIKINGSTFTTVTRKLQLSIIRIYNNPKLTAQEKLVKHLSKAFPNVTVELTASEYDKLQQGFIEKKLFTKNGKSYGFVKDGRVYLNPTYLNNNTPIHEFGHIWNAVAKNYRPELYKKGAELIKNTKYTQSIINSPSYQKIITQLFGSKAIIKNKATGKFEINTKAENFEDINDYITDEALARAIGDKGELFTTEVQKRKSFQDWMNLLFDAVKKIAGFESFSAEEFQNLTIDQFVNAALKELLGGKQISDITSDKLSDISKESAYAKFSVTDKEKEFRKNALAQGYTNKEIDAILKKAKKPSIAPEGKTTENESPTETTEQAEFTPNAKDIESFKKILEGTTSDAIRINNAIKEAKSNPNLNPKIVEIMQNFKELKKQLMASVELTEDCSW
jgi:GNAT superfamily N-acetyltransferase